MIGVPDERLGEAPKAFVVKKPGHQVVLLNVCFLEPSLRLTDQHPLRPNFPIFAFYQVTEEDIQAFMAERLAR